MGLKYLCFTQDHNLKSALLTFRDRYHLEPKEHKLEHGILRIGPIPGQDARLFEIIEIPGIGHNPGLEEQPLQLVMF